MLYNPPSGSTDPNAPYVGKDVASGRQGSKLPPTVPEGTQREIVAIIAAAQLMGLPAPSNSDLTQMLKAVRSGLLNRFVATGTPDAIAIAPTPAYVALVEGMRFRFKIPGSVGASNTTTAPTFTVSGLAAAAILRRDGAALAKGDLVSGRVVEVEIDAALSPRLTVPVSSETVATVLPYTPAGSRRTSAFTANVVLSDMPNANTDYVAQQTPAFTGASYAKITGSCSIANDNTSFVNLYVKARIVRTGDNTVVWTSQFLGGVGGNSIALPFSISPPAFQTLDPAQSYVAQLITSKVGNFGPTRVLDGYILAETN